MTVSAPATIALAISPEYFSPPSAMTGTPAGRQAREGYRELAIMKKHRLYLYDTTLRDGQQTPGIDFSVEDKIAISAMLDEFGLDYVEGGYPGANPTDTSLFSRKRTSPARCSVTSTALVTRRRPPRGLRPMLAV